MSNYNRGPPKDVYVDGSCLGNGQAGARGGYGVYWDEGNSNNVSEPVYGRQTNNSGEIQAATRAINDAGRMGYNNIRVNTDSDFLCKAATKWMPTWKQNDFLKSNGNPVVNREDFQNLDRAMQNNPNMRVEFRHVRGHSGNAGNEAADRLAKQGAQRGRYKFISNAIFRIPQQ